MSKQTKKVRETFEDEVTQRDFVLCLQNRMFSMFDREKFKVGDCVRVTVERIERPQRKGRRG